jgi:hypothetical protein
MLLRLELFMLNGVSMSMVGTVAAKQDDLLTRIRPPSQPGRETLGNHGALASEENEFLLAVRADDAKVTPEVLAIRARFAAWVFHALRARHKILDLRFCERQQRHAETSGTIVAHLGKPVIRASQMFTRSILSDRADR